MFRFPVSLGGSRDEDRHDQITPLDDHRVVVDEVDFFSEKRDRVSRENINDDDDEGNKVLIKMEGSRVEENDRSRDVNVSIVDFLLIFAIDIKWFILFLICVEIYFFGWWDVMWMLITLATIILQTVNFIIFTLLHR